MVSSPTGLELLTPDARALWVASGDECRATLDDENIGGLYGPPRNIRRRAPGAPLTIAVSCDPEVVEIPTVVMRLFLGPSSVCDL